MNKQLRNEIREYLDSFGDEEQLSVEDMSDLFFRANILLVRVLEEDKMKKYKVRLYFHTHVDVEVEADNEQDAREEAYCLAGTDEFNSQYMTNSQVDNDPDVEEIGDFEDERLTPQQKKELGYE